MRPKSARWGEQMLYELRSYDLRPGQALAYLELFRTSGIQLVTRHLPLAGYWLTDTGSLNRIYHLWIYESLKERAECRVGLAADKEWNEEFVPKGFPMIVAQQNHIMECTASSVELDQVVADRRRAHAGQNADQPMFSDTLLSLTVGRAASSDQRLGEWTILSGNGPQRQVSLFRHIDGDPFSTAKGIDRHEVLRALSCSPLR